MQLQRHTAETDRAERSRSWSRRAQLPSGARRDCHLSTPFPSTVSLLMLVPVSAPVFSSDRLLVD